MFIVSVIIPVYNSAAYVTKAVESAVKLPEVGEVILIEDGSLDNAIEICVQLTRQYEKVRLYQHPNGENRGAGASRNLGIDKSSFGFIAFLDADDWYLPHRFTKDRIIFAENSSADAAYSCTVLEHDNGYSLNQNYGVKFDPRNECGDEVTPLEFYAWNLKSKQVLFNTNSITLKKCFLMQDKCFDARLKLHQDSELWSRLIRRGNFYAAEWESPVAVIRRHTGNRITQRSPLTKMIMLAVMMENIGYENLFAFEKEYLFKQFLRNESKYFINRWRRRFNYYSQRFVNVLRQDHFLKAKMRKYAID